jgi:putative endonuclease
MAESHNLGIKGEDMAAEHLKKAGYKILDRNWRAGKLEVDIIAENKDFIVFVEVKTRSEDFLVDPKTAVNTEKRRSMIYAADTYLKRNNIDKECRFDLITVIRKGNTHQIDHLEDAFYPTLKRH